MLVTYALQQPFFFFLITIIFISNFEHVNSITDKHYRLNMLMM